MNIDYKQIIDLAAKRKDALQNIERWINEELPAVRRSGYVLHIQMLEFEKLIGKLDDEGMRVITGALSEPYLRDHARKVCELLHRARSYIDAMFRKAETGGTDEESSDESQNR